MTTAPPGRRELNKVRTREAVTAALRSLLEQTPACDITVDQVAERADISRRTFFNYYPAGLAAVIADVLRGSTSQLVEHLPPGALADNPVEGVRALLRTTRLDRDFLGWLAALNSHGTTSEQGVLLERAVWTDMGAWFRGLLVDQLPEGTDPLYVTTLADAVMSAFSAAEQPWFEGLQGRLELTETDVDDFLTHLDRALGYLASGWSIS